MGGCTSRSGSRTLNEIAPRPMEENVEMEAEDILRALRVVSDYIHQKAGCQITVFVVGGVVNTVLLRNRKSTHDVDFFFGKSNNTDQKYLKAAIQQARRRSKNPGLSSMWFNNHTQLFIPQGLRPSLAAGSMRQNAVVFEGRGLKLLAAPWLYQFCAKIERVVGGGGGGGRGGNGYDLPDAASYLCQHLRAAEQQSRSASYIDQLMRDYQIQTFSTRKNDFREVYRRINVFLAQSCNYRITNI